MKPYIYTAFVIIVVILAVLFYPYTMCKVTKFVFGGEPLQCASGSIASDIVDEINELKKKNELSYSGNTLTLQNGQTVDIPSSTQTLSDLTKKLRDSKLLNDGLGLVLQGTTLKLVGNTNGDQAGVNLSNLLVATDAQTLSISGNRLSISNGNSVTLPSTASTPTSLSLNTLSVSGSSNLAALQVSGSTNLVNLQVTGNTNLGVTNISGSLNSVGPNVLGGNTTLTNLTVNGTSTFQGVVNFGTLPQIPLTNGSILVGNSSNIANPLPIGSTSQVLSVLNGQPTWTDIGSIALTGTIFKVSDGTTSQDIVGGDTITFKKGPSGNLTVNVSATDNVSYDIITAPVFTGLTINGNTSFNGNTTTTGTATALNLSSTTLNVTGATTLNSLITTGPNTLGGLTTLNNTVTNGTVTNNGNVTNNGDVIFNNPTTFTDTVTFTVPFKIPLPLNNLLIGDSTGNSSNFPPGTNGQVLTINSLGEPVWSNSILGTPSATNNIGTGTNSTNNLGSNSSTNNINGTTNINGPLVTTGPNTLNGGTTINGALTLDPAALTSLAWTASDGTNSQQVGPSQTLTFKSGTSGNLSVLVSPTRNLTYDIIGSPTFTGLTVNGNSNFTGNATITGLLTTNDLTVSGMTTLNGNVTLGATAKTDLVNSLVLAGDVTGTLGATVLGADSVNSQNIIDGSIATSDISDGAITLSKISNCNVDGQILKYYPADPDGVGPLGIGWNCDTISASATLTASNGVLLNANNIELGGNLTKATTIGTSATNTLSFTGLQTATNSNELLSVDSNGVVQKAFITDYLVTGVITSNMILDGTISNLDLAGDSINSANILDGVVSLSDLGVDSVDSSKIVDGTVATADLADDSVTLSKIADCTMDNHILKYFTVDPDGAFGPFTVGWNCVVDVQGDSINGLNNVGTTTYLGGNLIQDTNITNAGFDLNMVGSDTTTTFDTKGFIGIGTNSPQTMIHAAIDKPDASLFAYPMTNVAAYYENIQPGSIATMYNTSNSAGNELDVIMGIQPEVYGGNGSFDIDIGYNGIPRSRIGANLVTGNWVVGTGPTSANAPGSKLSVLGNFAVGRNYQSIAAPFSGAIIEGDTGIGTSAPTNKLHVNGTNPLRLEGLQTGATSDTFLTADATGVVRQLTMTQLLGGTGTKVAVFAGDIDVQGQIDPNSIAFSTGLTTTYDAVTMNGFWIGPSSAAEQKPVFVAPATDAAGAFEVRKADLTTSVLTVNTINSRVGIGVANPSTSLDVLGRGRMRSNGVNTSGFSYLNFANTVDVGFIGAIDDGNLGFFSPGAGSGFVMNVANGNVGIGVGTVTPRRFNVRNDGDNLLATFTQGSSSCTINVLIGLVCTSDERLKENVVKVEDGLEIIGKLNPVTYNWKQRDSEKYIGFIAQEVQQVIPEAVNLDTTTGYLQLSAIEILPFVVKSIQEIDSKITQLSPSSQIAREEYILSKDPSYIELTDSLSALHDDVTSLKLQYEVLVSTLDEKINSVVDASITKYFAENNYLYLNTVDNKIERIEVNKDLVVGEKLVVNGETILNAKTMINGDVEIIQEITVSNNTAGSIIVDKTASKVKVTYPRPRVGNPIVTVTPRDVENGVRVNYSVINSDRIGFEIQIDTDGTTPMQDYMFNWISLSVK